MRFLFPPGRAFLCIARCPVSLAGAITPATVLRGDQDRPGAKAAGQPPPRPHGQCPPPGGRFPPAGSGAGPCVSRTCRSTGHRPARAGETRVAFPCPARKGQSLSPDQACPDRQAAGLQFRHPAKPARVLRQPTSPDVPPSGRGPQRPPPADRKKARNRSHRSLTSATSGSPAAPSAPREPAR